jgi:hypothetical protein
MTRSFPLSKLASLNLSFPNLCLRSDHFIRRSWAADAALIGAGGVIGSTLSILLGNAPARIRFGVLSTLLPDALLQEKASQLLRTRVADKAGVLYLRGMRAIAFQKAPRQSQSTYQEGPRCQTS